MKQILLSLIGDGAGNLSTTRVIVLIVPAAVILSKFYNAHLTGTPIEWTSHDLEIIGIVSGLKLVQNQQEKSNEKSS